MNPTEVEELARQHGSKSFWKELERRPWRQPTEYHLSQGSTFFHFWFFEDRLKVVQAGRRFGLEGIDLANPEHVCSMQPVALLELTIHVSPELAGAFVHLDGMYIGDLMERSGIPSANATIQILGLEPGQHHISIETGTSVVRRSFTFEPKNAWPQHDRISIDVSKPEHSGAA